MEEENKDTYKIYKYTFPDGKIYIGQTKRSTKIRYYDKYKHNKRISEAIKSNFWKYEDLKVEILADNLSKETANHEEIRFIASFNARDPEIGYNVSLGGNLVFYGLAHTKDSREKMSRSLIGKHSGLRNYNFGRICTQEEREKFRAAKRKYMRPVIQKNTDGKVIAEFESVSAAARSVNTSPKNIRCCIQGLSHHACGFSWEYKQGEIK